MEQLFHVPHGDRCATNQVLYNLGDRGIERDLLPWCRALVAIDDERALALVAGIHVLSAQPGTSFVFGYIGGGVRHHVAVIATPLSTQAAIAVPM